MAEIAGEKKEFELTTITLLALYTSVMKRLKPLK